MIESDYEGYVHIVFGVSMLFNSQINTNLDYYFQYGMSISDSETSTITQDVRQICDAYEDISAGEEMYIYYDGVAWFEHRGIALMNNSADTSDSKYSLDELDNKGVCITDVYADKSFATAGEMGLFAGKKFRAGELVVSAPFIH
jgi:hypothetical protein